MFGKHFKYQQLTEAATEVYLQAVKTVLLVKFIWRSF